MNGDASRQDGFNDQDETAVGKTIHAWIQDDLGLGSCPSCR
jgi:hypothetical protein